MRRLASLALLTLTACWVKPNDYWVEANYEDESNAAWCDWMLGCFASSSGWDNELECIEAQQANQQDFSQCVYDADSAQECVKGWWSLPCRAWDDGDFPAACDEVYDCSG